MQRITFSSLRSVFVSVSALGLPLLLAGCAQSFSFPNTNLTAGAATPQQVPAGSVRGNDYGGHAPLVGAHVFVLQIGTGGYGTAASSLLNAGQTGTLGYETFPTAQDTTAGSPTNGMYYVTTDAAGQFALNGTYTCTAGLPVYLYASGGNPNTTPAVTLTSITSVPGTGAYAGGTLSTFTNSGTNLLYQGEMVTFSGITGANAGFNGLTLPVVSTGLTAGQALTTSQFTVYYSLGAFTNSQTFGAGATASQLSANAPNNPAVVNLALLGNCPSTGSQNFSSLPYLYVNEVSTAAAAYALAPFASTASNDAVHIGTSSTNLLGLQSAVLTANNLYDIQGSIIGTGGDGDTHIARTYTAGPAFTATENGTTMLTNVSSTANLAVGKYVYGLGIPQGTTVTNISGNTVTLSAATTASNAGISLVPQGLGTVPQQLINTVGNILASCVDSANTFNAVTAPGGVPSTQCTNLFTYATANGTAGGTKPNDTATAALNIAHYPDGAAGNTNYVSNIFNTITGNSPFQPTYTTAPHDYTVAITWPTPGGGISGTTIDGQGNVWTVGGGSNSVYEWMANSGTFTTYAPPTGSTVTNTFISSAAVDATSSNVYVPAGAGMLKFTPGNTTGTLITSANTSNASGVTLDNSGNLFVANTVPANQASSYVQKETIGGVAAGSPFPIIDSDSIASCTYQVQYVLTDGSGNVWTSGQGNAAPANAICRYNNAGVLQYKFQYPYIGSPLHYPLSYGFAIDKGGNLWFSDKDNSAVYKISNGATGTFESSSTNQVCGAATGCTQTTGGTVDTPFSAAIDGNNTVWVSNSVSGSLAHFSNAAASLVPTYLGGGSGYLINVLTLEVDQSGSVWGNSYTSNNLIQYVGVAAPTVQPLSLARLNGTLGSTP